MLTEQSKQLDKALLDGLERVGFRLDFGDDGTGWQFKYLSRGGGYYFNVGCSDLVVSGAIRLAQFSDVDRFVAEGARLKSGDTLKADLVASGAIKLAQFTDIDAFVADGARLKNGKTIEADLIVLATGYRPQEELVRKLFGDAVADRVGPIWGFGEEQELRNMYTRTKQAGLYFIAGSLAQCRINSKYLALQIKAIEEGLLPRSVRTMEEAAA